MVIVDSHVHLHDCFPEEMFLSTAAANLRAAAQGRAHYRSLLLLTESAGSERFRELKAALGDSEEAPFPGAGGWNLLPTGEEESLLVRPQHGPGFYLAAGRQIVTAEDLEVLALVTAGGFEERRPIRETIGRVLEAGGPAIIPWGFGKWTGSRGETVREILIDPNRPEGLFLGDNGGRTAILGEPGLFETARELGVRVLPGSDPLPFPHQAGRAGSHGFRIEAEISPQKPARDLKRLLLDKSTVIEPFGRMEGLPRFVRNQVAIQLKKRFGKKPGGRS